MLKKDVMTVEILDGGIIKITSADAISAPNHANAESLIREIRKDAGGKTTQKHLKKGHAHTHTHADGSTTTHGH